MKLLNPENAAKIRNIANSYLFSHDGNGSFFRNDFLQKRNFCCVLFQGDFYDTGESIAKLCSLAGVPTVQCGSTTEHHVECYSFIPLHENLTRIRKEYVDPSYFITDEFKNFMVVSDSDYYWAVAAPFPFLKTIFTESLLSIAETFRNDFASFRSSQNKHNRFIGGMMEEFTQISVSSIKMMS